MSHITVVPILVVCGVGYNKSGTGAGVAPVQLGWKQLARIYDRRTILSTDMMFCVAAFTINNAMPESRLIDLIKVTHGSHALKLNRNIDVILH